MKPPPVTPLRSLINLVNQLNTTNLTLPQLIQALQHALQAARANLSRVHSELLAREQLRSKLPERLAELKVLRLRGHVHAAEELEGFAGDGVAESCLRDALARERNSDFSEEGRVLADLVLNISTVMLRVKQVRHRASLGRDSLGADLRRVALGNTIKDLGELVAGVLADFLRALRVVVVESLGSAQRLDEGEVARRASRHHFTARQNSELNRQAASRGAAAVDEQRFVGLLSTARQRQAEALVETLADGCDAHAEGGGVFVREVVRKLALDVALCYGVLREAAVLFFYGVDAVGEACDAVAFLEVLGDFGADFNDGARVVAACGATLALLSEAGDGDVLPFVRLAGARHWFGLGASKAYQSVLGEREVSRAHLCV
jgi:hypothetical protein